MNKVLFDDSYNSIFPVAVKVLNDLGITKATQATRRTFYYCVKLVQECEGLTKADLELMVGSFHDGYLDANNQDV